MKIPIEKYKSHFYVFYMKLTLKFYFINLIENYLELNVYFVILLDISKVLIGIKWVVSLSFLQSFINLNL